MPETFINLKTAEKLTSPTPAGTRHNTAIQIALDLLGNGLSDTAVFETLRGKYDSSLTDTELRQIISWASQKHPSPSLTRGNGHHVRTDHPKKRTPIEHTRWWLSGRQMTLEQFTESSQLPIPSDRQEQLRIVLELIYDGADSLNIVCDFIERDSKACPKGAGKILSRDGWLEYLGKKGVPQSKAGAWFRPNPCGPKGSGTSGAVMDSDISAHRFLLLESDVLPLEMQLMLFSKLKLPISVVLLSGGLSAHAWVRLGCSNATDFSERARRIVSALAPFGIDQANKNPSRLSRLPGALRVIGAKGTGLQSLLWLNPGKMDLKDDELELFESSLEFPALEEKPFKKVVQDALVRYEELFNNQGKTGVPTGIADFDRDTGGLKPGQMMVVSAESGSGKSSVALNIANAALAVGKPVALFTLEMLNEDIADILFAMNCKIERDKFNTGRFFENDLQAMVRKAATLANYPFWSCDESRLNVDQIRKRVLQLKREFNVELVIVDYAQIVSSQDNFSPREQQVAEISRGLCAIAKDAKVPVVVLSQVNDQGKLRESRVIGHEAHIVVSLENHESDGRIIFHVVKGRRIQKKSYVLHYEPQFCFVKSESKIKDDDIPRQRSATPDP